MRGKEMDKEQYCAAKVRLVTHMQEGQPWRGAAATAGIHISQSTAYRLLQEVHMRGEAALQDGRHGHPSKLRGAARTFLENTCREAPRTPSSVIQRLLQERFDVNVSISQINRVRRQLGVSNHSKNWEPGKKQQQRKYFPLKECGRKGQEVFCSWLLRNKRRPSRSWKPLSPQRSSPLLPHCVLLTANRQPCAASCSPCSFWKP